MTASVIAFLVRASAGPLALALASVVLVSGAAVQALEMEGVDAKTRKAMEKALADVDGAAQKHLAAIDKSLGKRNNKRTLEDKPWVGHARLFLRHFRGTPRCDDFEKDWAKTLERHEKAGKDHGTDYWKSYESDAVDAFAAGVELVANAFLRHSTEDPRILDRLDGWADEAKSLELKKSQMRAYEASVPVFRSALEKGEKAFTKAGRRYR